MLIFINFGGGGGRFWWVGPLLGVGVSLLSGLLQDAVSTRWYAGRPAPRYDRRRGRYQYVPEAPGPWTFDLVDLVLAVVLLGLAAMAVQAIRRRGGLAAMWRQGQARAAQQAAAQAGRQGRQQARARRPDFDQIAAALGRLPTEVVATREDLEKETIPELRARLLRLGAEARGCLEKRELVERVLEAAARDSSGESCAICAEDYAPGDVVRVLPCGHRLHLECVDRWLLKSAEHSAPKGCPLCNDDSWISRARPAEAAAAAGGGAAAVGGGAAAATAGGARPAAAGGSAVGH